MKRASSREAYQGFEKLREQLGLSKRQFIINYLNLPNAQIYTHWANRGVPLEMVLLIAKSKGYDANALLEGRLVEATENSNVVSADPPPFRVPVISWVRAGNFDTVLDQRLLDDVSQWLYLPKKPGPRAFGLYVKGPSMEPRFSDGDYLVVDPDAEWKDGDFVILSNGNDEATFKQIVLVDNEWWARPLNPQFAAKKMDVMCRVIGRVIWHQKPPTAL
ncbi:LexA family protein [Acidithiobacillus caldus]